MKVKKVNKEGKDNLQVIQKQREEVGSNKRILKKSNRKQKEKRKLKLKFIEDYSNEEKEDNSTTLLPVDNDVSEEDAVEVIIEEQGHEPEEMVQQSKEDLKKNKKEGRKKKRIDSLKKIPKIRRTAATEGVEENFLIVPWESIEEWNNVCTQLHSQNYHDVKRKIAVWQRRVPSLPVGAEATLFLLEALLYDQKFLKSRCSSGEKEIYYTEEQARALYSLAIIRYLNHVNHLAAESLGKATTRPSGELAAIMDTPDWLVSLRNDVSHGPRAPSIEVLRLGGEFVLQWLQDKYWKLPGSVKKASDPFTVVGRHNSNEDDIPSEISKCLAAYVAVRIYKKRHQQMISDPDILSLLPLSSSNSPVKCKVAVAALRSSLRGYLASHPFVFCGVVSEELCPNGEFYGEFLGVFSRRRKNKGGKENDDDDDDDDEEQYNFEQLFSIWMPIIKMLESKGKLMAVLSNLCEIVVDPEYEKVWSVAGRWVDKILGIIEDSERRKRYSSKQLAGLLKEIVKHPNDYTYLYLERFFKLTEPRLGSGVIEKLSLLVAIWLESSADETVVRKQRRKLFSLNDNRNVEADADGIIEMDTNVEGVWKLDARDAQFWKNIPLGGVVM